MSKQHPPERDNSIEWQSECEFISRHTSLALRGQTHQAFQGDPSAVRRYAQMQQRAAELQRKFDVVEYLGHCIDDLAIYG